MYGIPMAAADPPAAPKTYGYYSKTPGAYSVANPAGAIGAWITIQSANNGGISVAKKYVAIPKGNVVTFSGTIGNSSTATTMTAPVSVTAPINGTPTGGDINVYSSTDYTPLSPTLGAVEIIWNYGD